jgi:CRISPR-associated Csx2 family protein
LTVKLITFIGTNEYLPCRYQLGDRLSKPGRFIQTSLAEILMENPEEEREIIVFMTEEARKRNWFDRPKDDGKILEGLTTELNSLRQNSLYEKITLKEVRIPEGFSTEDIWVIFQKLQDTLEAEDEIILDITHSFRSIPLLVLLLVNYARLFKDFSVRGIYYGAFEQLGPVRKVEAEIPLDKRIANIVDLKEFFQLFNWSIAMDKFLDAGNTKQLHELASQELKPLRVNAGGRDPDITVFWRFIDILHRFSQEISTCRTKTLINTTSQKLASSFSQVKDRKLCYIEALIPMIEVVADKLKGIQDDNCFSRGHFLAEWCLNHGLIQQGWTIFQENLISLLCEGLGIENGKWMENRDSCRETVSSAASLICKKNWENAKCEDDKYAPIIRKYADMINKDARLKKAAKLLDVCRGYRNDLDHGEFKIHTHKTEAFIKQLGNMCLEYRALIEAKAWEARTDMASSIENVNFDGSDDNITRKTILLSPMGMSPGTLYTALNKVSPDCLLVVTSEEAAKKLPEVIEESSFAGSMGQILADDPFMCFYDEDVVVSRLMEMADKNTNIVVNITGGTTALQYLVRKAGDKLAKKNYSVKEVAAMDRRSAREQAEDPYVLGELVELKNKRG